MNPEYLRTYQASSLESLLQEKAKCLASILEDILRDIAGREELSQAVLSDLEVHASRVKSLLLQTELSVDHRRWPYTTTRRQALEKQLDTLKEEKRRERVQAWQDKQKLKEEFRRWWKQYQDQKQRTRLLQ